MNHSVNDQSGKETGFPDYSDLKQEGDQQPVPQNNEVNTASVQARNSDSGAVSADAQADIPDVAKPNFSKPKLSNRSLPSLNAFKKGRSSSELPKLGLGLKNVYEPKPQITPPEPEPVHEPVPEPVQALSTQTDNTDAIAAPMTQEVAEIPVAPTLEGAVRGDTPAMEDPNPETLSTNAVPSFATEEDTQYIPVTPETAADTRSPADDVDVVLSDSFNTLDPELYDPIEAGATDILATPDSLLQPENRWDSADIDLLPKPGDRIDHYEVIEEVGRGGFGAVYRVRNLILDRDEALKLILPDAKSDVKDIDKRFEREINIVSRLEHPNVVRLYSSGKLNNDILWMSMEYIRGELLGLIMDREGAMPFFRAKNIMLQVLSGLQDAHELEIVHRDLKPSNIMISKRKGYDELVYILDFGLSKAIGNSEDAAVQNVTTNLARSIYGTPNYMAPEQFALAGNISPSVDVYAAGIIFLELLTGVHAFMGSVFEIALQQQTKVVPIPDHLKNTAIEAVILKACQKNPLLRYQTAGEFYDALSKIKTITDSPRVLTAIPEPLSHTDETQYLEQPLFVHNRFELPGPLKYVDEVRIDIIKQWPFVNQILFYACFILAFFAFLFFVLMIVT